MESLIDKETGAVHFPSIPRPIGSWLTHDQVDEAEWAKDREPIVLHGEWRSWLLRDLLAGGESWILSLYFHRQRLWQVCLTESGNRWSKSWEDFTNVEGERHKAAHDAYLAEWKVPVGRYPWGTLTSLFTPIDGNSALCLTYGDRPDARGT